VRKLSQQRPSSWQHELVLRWEAPHRPLPRRAVQPLRARVAVPPTGQEWHLTGPVGSPFDFCDYMRRLIEDIIVRCPEFAHVQPAKVLLGFTQARSGRVHGLQGRVTPLRFIHGQLVRQRHGVPYQVQRYFLDDHEFLYLMTFCLPRYLDQSFEDKLITVFHELHHIHPEFNGDLRRHAGRCRWHTASKHDYDREMAELARIYLSLQPDPNLMGFLRLTFAELVERHSAVVGIVVPRPKLIPIATVQTTAGRSSACGNR
jgi:hypothetical protein